MKPACIIEYLVVVLIVGLFWRISYKADTQLRAMFAEPVFAGQHRTLASANEEIAYLRGTQNDLLGLHHTAHVRFTWTALLVLLVTLPLQDLFRRSKKEPNKAPEPTP